ncbi:MAG: GNAT family N-acetyltransferase [Kouleothrix sp.]
MATIEAWAPTQAADNIGALSALLIDSVMHGASIGFLPPLHHDEAQRYWDGVIADLRAGRTQLLVAQRDGLVLGSAQLALAEKPNARHRAEVQKVMVHSSARRQGLATALMHAIDTLARAQGRTLLVLDTRQGDPSEQLYQQCGYTLAGIIPAYAQNGAGGHDATAIYYRLLPAML